MFFAQTTHRAIADSARQAAAIHHETMCYGVFHDVSLVALSKIIMTLRQKTKSKVPWCACYCAGQSSQASQPTHPSLNCNPAERRKCLSRKLLVVPGSPQSAGNWLSWRVPRPSRRSRAEDLNIQSFNPSSITHGQLYASCPVMTR